MKCDKDRLISLCCIGFSNEATVVEKWVNSHPLLFFGLLFDKLLGKCGSGLCCAAPGGDEGSPCQSLAGNGAEFQTGTHQVVMKLALSSLIQPHYLAVESGLVFTAQCDIAILYHFLRHKHNCLCLKMLYFLYVVFIHHV